MRFNIEILKVWDVRELHELFFDLPFNLNLFASSWFTGHMAQNKMQQIANNEGGGESD